jgi:hypothetical protein
MTVESRGATFRDFAIFQIKLLIDVGKDAVIFGLSIAAMALDYFAGRGQRPRLFYSVMRISERFDKWLNLHSSLDRLEDTDENLFKEAEAGSDKLLAEFEQLMKPKKPKGPPTDRL